MPPASQGPSARHRRSPWGRHARPCARLALASAIAALLAVVVTGAVLLPGMASDDGASAASTTTSASAQPGVYPTDVAPADVSPTDAPPAQPMVKSVPVRLQIPAIGVDSALTGLGLRSDGAMEVPSTGFPAGWYTGAPTPGELGPAVVVGHVDWAGSAGVFYRLRDLKANDEVAITRDDGSRAVFRVSTVKQYPKSKFPTGQVYDDIGFPGLRLVTCGGSFDRQARSYDDNIIAFAELI